MRQKAEEEKQMFTNLSTATGTHNYYWLLHVKHRRLQTKYYDIASHKILLLLMSGIEPNPGPRRPKYPCGICKKACKLGTIACDECDQWLHKTCISMSSTEYSRLGNCSDRWTCPNCEKPNNSSIIYATPLSNEQSYTTENINQSEHLSLIQSESDFSFPSASSITDESRSSISSDGNSTFNILPQTNGITTSSPNPIRPTSTKNQNKMNATTRKNGLRILNINFQSLRKKGQIARNCHIRLRS